MLGSLGDGRSACRTPSCPRPAPAAAVRTRAAGSRCRWVRSLPNHPAGRGSRQCGNRAAPWRTRRP